MQDVVDYFHDVTDGRRHDPIEYCSSVDIHSRKSVGSQRLSSLTCSSRALIASQIHRWSLGIRLPRMPYLPWLPRRIAPVAPATSVPSAANPIRTPVGIAHNDDESGGEWKTTASFSLADLLVAAELGCQGLRETHGVQAAGRDRRFLTFEQSFELPAASAVTAIACPATSTARTMTLCSGPCSFLPAGSRLNLPLDGDMTPPREQPLPEARACQRQSHRDPTFLAISRR